MTGHDLPLHISGRGRTGFARNVSQLCETRRIREKRISRPMYGKPSTWPSRLSLSPSLLEDPPYPRDVSRCQGACIYRRERTVGDAAHPTCCSSPSNSFQASIPPRKSTPAEIYERVETLDIKMARAIEKYDSFSLSLSPFHETLLFSTRTRKLLFIERSNNGRGIISRLLLRDSSTPPLNCSRNSVELKSFSIRVQ